VYCDVVNSERSKLFCEKSQFYRSTLSAGQIVRHLNKKARLMGERFKLDEELGAR